MKHLSLLSLFLWPCLLQALTVGTPVTLSNNVNNYGPQVDINPTGSGVAVWTQGFFPYSIQAAYLNGTTKIWTAPVTLASGSTPQVEIDYNGNAIAVWVNSTTNQIMASRYTASNSVWSTPVAISTQEINPITQQNVNGSPQISLNGSGNGAAVWVQNVPFAVYMASFNGSTLTWSAPILIASNSSLPRVALDDLNQGIVTWQNFSTGAIQAANFVVP